ncbi:hypothetical protein C1H46_014334 [Malus baccata]|uniref:Uncharacterized protein n=1 Tax=Malus baccata TaxID=106549 RepID=A0A540MMR2_MALBA|nr:hypothetical protein C1H46_014334 [Malus baccata]
MVLSRNHGHDNQESAKKVSFPMGDQLQKWKSPFDLYVDSDISCRTRVVLDQLPNEANDIIDILKAEQAFLDLWLIITREYFKQGKVEQFRQILDGGSCAGQLLLA